MQAEGRFVAWLLALRAFFGVGEKRAAWAAIRRCYGIPYLREINSLEHHGLTRLEQAGLVERDEGFTGLHWHLTEKGRKRL